MTPDSNALRVVTAPAADARSPVRRRGLESDRFARPRLRTAALAAVLAGFLVRFLFLRWRAPDAVSHDVLAWDDVARDLRAGVDPYVATAYLSWPPVWMQVVFVLDRVATALGISLHAAVFGFLIAAESALLLVTFRFAHRLGSARPARLVALGIALNPICLLLVCQHGNFDVLVGLFVILALLALRRFRDGRRPEDWLLACLWVGLGTATKTVPLVLAPLLAVGWRGVPRAVRALGVALTFGPALYGTSILYVLAPERIAGRVVGYRSGGLWFGFPGLLHLFGRDEALRGYGLLFEAAFFVVAAVVTRRMLRAETVSDRALVLLPLLLLAAIPTLGPGFATQYLYWYWPLVLLAAIVGSRDLRFGIAAFAAIAVATYAVEYAFVPILGAALSRTRPAFGDPVLSIALDTPYTLTVLRLPFFGASLLLLALAARDLVLPAAGRPLASRTAGAAS